MIIGLVGLINSGKGTVGDYLKSEYGFILESFAKPIKDATSIIFGWDRYLLEGDTKQSREFRENVDEWWTEQLGFGVTPRLIMQKFGTEAIRDGIHPDVWIYSLAKRIEESPYTDFVVTDVRFFNEMDTIKNLGGYLINVKRGDNPVYYSHAVEDNLMQRNYLMKTYYPELHESEWRHFGYPDIDYVIENNGTLEELYRNIDNIMKRI